MKNDIEVSVVIPIYNGMPYLKDTIAGILNQTYRDFELILVNDGSTDESEKYIKSLEDKRIRYISQTNIGLCNTLNKAFSLAQGKYIIRNDQDDVSEPQRIEKQIKAIAKSSYDCIFSYITKISQDKEWSNIDKLVQHENILRDFDPWIDGCMVNSTMAIKKEVFEEIGGYRQEYYPSDDWDLELRLSQKYSVGVLEESLLKYRFHDTANTYKYWQLMQDTRRWGEDSYFRRKSKQKELEFEEYLTDEKKNLLNYYNRRRKDTAKLYMRKAGSSFLSNNYFLLLGYLLLTTLYDPKAIFKRVFNLFKNKLIK